MFNFWRKKAAEAAKAVGLPLTDKQWIESVDPETIVLSVMALYREETWLKANGFTRKSYGNCYWSAWGISNESIEIVVSKDNGWGFKIVMAGPNRWDNKTTVAYANKVEKNGPWLSAIRMFMELMLSVGGEYRKQEVIRAEEEKQEKIKRETEGLVEVSEKLKKHLNNNIHVV